MLEVVLELGKFRVRPDTSVREALCVIDRNTTGGVLVLDDSNKLFGTVTDGDLRRAILAGLALEAPLTEVLDMRRAGAITAASGTSEAAMLEKMRKSSIRHLPLLDRTGAVTGLAIIDESRPDFETHPPRAVIMAGGFGKRLHPLTLDTPKPMLPVAGRPMMEHIINRLQSSGIRHVHVTTHYHPDKIRDHFGDGGRFGLSMDYVSELFPLGTAGSLALIPDFDRTHLVVNGDVLTHVDFRRMMEFHRDNRALITLGVRKYEVEVPYGVVDCDGSSVKCIDEKPKFDFFVNAGIYLVEPSVLRYIPADQRFDMTDLVRELIKDGRLVSSFPVVEYWLDVGRPEDYAQAQTDFSPEEQSAGALP